LPGREIFYLVLIGYKNMVWVLIKRRFRDSVAGKQASGCLSAGNEYMSASKIGIIPTFVYIYTIEPHYEKMVTPAAGNDCSYKL
jgi:hypothetical protein